MDKPRDVEQKGVKILLELNEELENYFRNTIIPQIFIDADLILRKYSPPANMHFTLAETDMGKSIYDIPTLAILPGLIDTIKEVIASNEDIESEIQTKDQRWFQMNVLPYIVKKKNTTNGVVITFIDITERLADKLAIEKINADHETFIYSVSHDFKQPIRNMLSLLDALRSALEKDDKHDINELLNIMDRAAQSMETVIAELTTITKIGTNPEDQKEVVSIAQILDEDKFSLKNQIYQSHAKITSNLEVTEVQFSKKNLRSILYNLLSNAIKFIDPEKLWRFLSVQRIQQNISYSLYLIMA